MTLPVHRWLSQRPTKKPDIEYQQFVLQQLVIFTLGEPVDNQQYMKRLKGAPGDVWEIRISLAPQSRIFGAFVVKDCFLCTNMRLRGSLRGGIDSRDWRSAKNRSAMEWDKLFPGHRRFRGVHFDHYVSNGVHHDW